MTAAAFKRSIRDLQVWCSSCMVAFSGSDPIGVLIGAKRPSGTLVQKIAVHPDHLRQGHARHLLTSISSKLAILGPPRIMAQVPETLVAGCELFSATGYVPETQLTDYVRPRRGAAAGDDNLAAPAPGLVIPVTVDDLLANGLIGEDQVPTCWERSVATLTARKHEISGLAVVSDEEIKGCLLWTAEEEIVLLRSFVQNGEAGLEQLLTALDATRPGPFGFSKVHPAEISAVTLERLGFRRAGRHVLYAVAAQSH